MKRIDIPLYHPVSLVWLDSAYLAEPGWHYPDEAGVFEGMTVELMASLGYVVENTKSYLVISSSIASNGGAFSPLSIPWVSILKLERLTLGGALG